MQSHRQESPRYRTRNLGLFSVALVSLATLFIVLSEDLNEYVEHRLIKQGPFHNFMHRSNQSTHVPPREELIVYVHIPRTSGETLKLTLFNDVAYQYNPEWVDALHCDPDCKMYWNCTQHRWLCRRFKKDFARNHDEMGPPHPWPWDDNLNEVQKALDVGNVVQGFFSRLDILRLRNITRRKLVLFTVLRHPIERTLSWLGMINSSCPRVPWARTCAGATPLAYYSMPPLVRTDVGEARRSQLESHVVSFAHNGMTWQLGHQMHSSFRSIPEKEALARAKQFLGEMDYVGFFEDMFWDFPRLSRAIFPHAESQPIYFIMFMLGTLLGYPRMHTLKYFAHLNETERHAVRAANNLDIELYDWAKLHFGSRTRFYNSYAACAWAILPVPISVVVLATFGIRKLLQGHAAAAMEKRN